jgi:hypothetical protein
MEQNKAAPDSLDALRRTLLWAAGGTGAPAFADVDESVLLEALRLHRLDSRMWHRILSSAVPASPTLRAEVRARHQRNMDRTAEQITRFATLREALRAMTGADQVLPLKGFGLYALTGREEHVRFSADLDVIGASAADVAKAALTVTNEGYHHHGEEHPYVFAHMRNFEVHARYVITGFPAGEDRAAYDPALHRQALLLPKAFTESTVTYDDLAGDVVTGTQGARVPIAEMALLIRCAHIYVGYAMDPRPLPVATVRLDELAPVNDLVNHPAFSPRRFTEICRRFRADLVVGFAGRLCREFFGTDPFASSGIHSAPPGGEHDWFPQNLWWDGTGAGFPVWLGWSPQDLIVRGPAVPDLVHHLGPMRVPVGADHTAQVTLLGAGATAGARYIALNHRSELAFAEVRFEFLDRTLRTTVYLPRTPHDQMSAIGVASGDSRVELFFKPREGTAEFSDWSVNRLPAADVSSSAVVEGDRHVLVTELPWAMFGRDRMPERGDSVQLLVRARQQVRPWAEVTAGIIVPVTLVRAE